MNTENEFNKYLGAEFKKVGTKVKAFKVSDRFHVGAADWLIFADGHCHAIEAKFIKKIPKRGNLLKHIVSGPQITFLRSLDLTDTPCWVLVGVGELRTMFLFFWDAFKENGNMTVEYFRRYCEEGEVYSFPMNEVGALMHHLSYE